MSLLMTLGLRILYDQGCSHVPLKLGSERALCGLLVFRLLVQRPLTKLQACFSVEVAGRLPFVSHTNPEFLAETVSRFVTLLPVFVRGILRC